MNSFIHRWRSFFSGYAPLKDEEGKNIKIFEDAIRKL